MSGEQFIKDPDAVLDYTFDWAPLENSRDGATSNWLDRTSSPIEGISTRTITVSPSESPEVLVVDSSSIVDTNTGVRVWLSGGAAGKRYRVHCKIVTDASTPRTDERYIEILCTQR